MTINKQSTSERERGEKIARATKINQRASLHEQVSKTGGEEEKKCETLKPENIN